MSPGPLLSLHDPGLGGARGLTAALLVLVATVLAASALAPVFEGPGVLLNQDHPIHYQRLWGFLAGDGHAMVPSWNPYMNAGRPYFHAYPLLFHEVARAAAWVFDPVLAYKLAVVLVYLVAPVSAFALCAVLDRPLAGAFAAALCLVAPGSPQSGGFVQLLLAGLAPSSLATALLPLGLAASLALLEEPGRRRLAAAAAAAAALLLAHVVSFSVFALALGAAAPVYLRDPRARRWPVLALPLLTAGLAAFWLLPVAVRRLQGYFVPAFGGDTVARSMYSPQLFHKYFWTPLSGPLLALALAGLAAALLAGGRRARARRALALALPLIPALWLAAVLAPSVYAYLPIDRLIQLQRAAADLYMLIVVLAGLGLGELARVRLRLGRRRVPAGLALGGALGLALVASLGGQTRRMSRHLVTLPEDVRARHEALYGVLAKRPGRVLHEETLFRVPPPLGRTHLEALMPTYHGGESFSFDSFGFREDWGFLDLADLLREQAPDAASARALFERLAVGFVITTTRETERLLHDTVRLGTVEPWTVHATRIRPGYFALADGEVLEASYRRTEADARVRAPRATRLLFKVHDYPNWRVTLAGRPAERVNRLGSLMEVAVPPGEHRVSFRYGLTALDGAAYALTAASLLAAAWLGRP